MSRLDLVLTMIGAVLICYGGFYVGRAFPRKTTPRLEKALMGLLERIFEKREKP